MSAVPSKYAPYDARAVANHILELASERRLVVTQLVLYKILYFAHGWYLTSVRRPLITQQFEAWQRGPVVKVLRDQFRKFGENPISERAERLDIFSGEFSVVEPLLQASDAAFVEHVFDSYHHYGAWKLSEMTHEPGSPWDRLWNAQIPVGRLALRIKNEEIKAHFDGLSARFKIL